MAKRIQFSAVGGPEVLEYVDFEPQAPGPQAVVVRNKAIGLNFIDTYYRSGLYPAPSLPSGLGAEGAGVVEAVGAEVTRFKIGDRVAYGTGPLGAYSEVHVLPEANLVKLADSISFEQAAALMLKGLTVQYLLRQTYQVKPGETILFHAAAGGVGSLACQWVKALGAKLIGTVSSPEKAAHAKALGAWETIDYSHEDVARRVLELTDGKKMPGGLRRSGPGHLADVTRLRGTTWAGGELRQCVRAGLGRESRDSGAKGFGVCHAPDAGLLRQQCAEPADHGGRAVRHARQRQTQGRRHSAVCSEGCRQGADRAVGPAYHRLDHSDSLIVCP